MSNTLIWNRYIAGSLLTFGLLNSTAAFCLSAVWDNWLNSIHKDLGYSVVQGSAHVFELSDCAAEIQVFNSCGGNNPAAPYIEIQPPVSNGTANEFVDPCYITSGSNCGGTLQSRGSVVNAFTAAIPSGGYVNQYYRLADQDAVVVIVSLPPRSAYLGYQSYVFSRGASQYSVLPTICGPVGGIDLCRAPVLGSVGNSINNIALKNQSASLALPAPSATTAAPEVVFITTSNSTLYSKLRKSFLSRSVGGSSQQVFVEPLYRKNEYSGKPPLILGSPYSGVNVVTGFDTSDMSPPQAMSDEFNTLMRYAAFEDSTASKRWLCAINQASGNTTPDCQNLGSLPASPIAVYRITKNASRFDSLYTGKSVLTARAANHDETNLNRVNYNTVASDLATALQNYMSKTATMSVRQAGAASNVGPDCITYDSPCFEDSQDTAPYGTLNAGQINDSNGNVAFVVGVNHANTTVNNATYMSVGVYDGGSLSLQNFDI